MNVPKRVLGQYRLLVQRRGTVTDRANLRKERSRLLRAAGWQDRILQVFAVALPAGLLGVSDFISEWQASAVAPLQVAAIGCGGLAVVYILLVKRTDPDIIRIAETAWEEAREAGRALADLKIEQAHHAQAGQLRMAMMEALETVLEDGGDPPYRFKKLASWILDLLAYRGIASLRLEQDNWTISVFWFVEGEGRLVPVGTRRRNRMDELKPQRSWQPGQGQVGRAFSNGSPLVLADTGTPEARQSFEAPEVLRKPDDVSKYRSIASLPIKVGRGQPIGVLVATSNVAGRFKPEKLRPASVEIDLLHVAADLLALAGSVTPAYNREVESRIRK